MPAAVLSILLTAQINYTPTEAFRDWMQENAQCLDKDSRFAMIYSASPTRRRTLLRDLYQTNSDWKQLDRVMKAARETGFIQ